jgi:hypothetical protein
MIWTAWNNGEHHSTGAGYGFKIDGLDRDRYFDPKWCTVVIEFPTRSGRIVAEANVAKKSFWASCCRELINKTVRRWLIDQGYAPWTDGQPPRFEVDPSGERRFRVGRPLS